MSADATPRSFGKSPPKWAIAAGSFYVLSAAWEGIGNERFIFSPFEWPYVWTPWHWVNNEQFAFACSIWTSLILFLVLICASTSCFLAWRLSARWTWRVAIYTSANCGILIWYSYYRYRWSGFSWSPGWERIPQVIAAFAIAAIVGHATRLERMRRGECPKCEYPLLGINSDRCPECGTPIESTHLLRPPASSQ